MSNSSQHSDVKTDAQSTQIIALLAGGESFLVEAGAGSGKTHSLMESIKWLEHKKRAELARRGQRVACITYTNVAVDNINSRLESEGFIEPSTIHAFAWGFMKNFQSSLVRECEESGLITDENGTATTAQSAGVSRVSYELGVRFVEDGTLYLYHDDVIEVFARLLDNSKFRMMLADRYPVILIDEYQDSSKLIMNQFIKYYVDSDDKSNGFIQFGMFGDSWQTIYSDGGACGAIESERIIRIGKESNYRSQKVIVDVLNKMRPCLLQISACEENDGKAFVITCNDYIGRRQGGYYKDELPFDELSKRVEAVRGRLRALGWSDEFITLMLTHKMLARQQGYEALSGVLGNHLKQNDDAHILFFESTVEPVYAALVGNRTRELFNVLGISRRPIRSYGQKQMWKALKDQLEVARGKTVYDVLEVVSKSKVIGLPDEVASTFAEYDKGKDVLIHKNVKASDLYSVQYEEVIKASKFLSSDSGFSTDHGVKGEGYENVLLVMGRGWNNYRFDSELYKDESTLSGKKLENYIRNRNLFYVCCSRAKKHLAVLVTVPVFGEFENYLQRIFGVDNIISYQSFMDG